MAKSTEPNPPLALRYIGTGGAFQVGVPLRDMTAEEVAGWHLPLVALLDAGYLVPVNVEDARRLGVWPRPK
jgi:hypothetical protein